MKRAIAKMKKRCRRRSKLLKSKCEESCLRLMFGTIVLRRLCGSDRKFHRSVARLAVELPTRLTRSKNSSMA